MHCWLLTFLVGCEDYSSYHFLLSWLFNCKKFGFSTVSLFYVINQFFFLFCRSKLEDMTTSFDVCKKLAHDIIRIKDAQLDDPPRLEEKNWCCDESKNGNAQLCGAHVPGGDEVEEDYRRDHQEEGGYMVCKAEAP